MKMLVGDVGGTNTRMALVGSEGVLQDTIRRFRNDEFSDFSEPLAAFLEGHGQPTVSKACFAIAGPCEATEAELTNRDWVFRSQDISRQLRAAPVYLVNDLSALGHALPAICPKLLSESVPDTTGQKIVIGVGTGFNICQVKISPTGETSIFEAELGHAALPGNVGSWFVPLLKDETGHGLSVEQCFSGSGLSDLYKSISGTGASSEDIMAQYVAGRHEHAERAVCVFAKALGKYCQQLVYQYLPRLGLIFAGSVARNVLASPSLDVFLEAFREGETQVVKMSEIPVSVIEEDAAALHGCVEILRRAHL